MAGVAVGAAVGKTTPEAGKCIDLGGGHDFNGDFFQRRVERARDVGSGDIERLFGQDQVDLVLSGGLRFAVETRAHRVGIDGVETKIDPAGHRPEDGQRDDDLDQSERAARRLPPEGDPDEV